MLFKIDVLENLANSLGNTCAGVYILKRCRFLACNFTKNDFITGVFQYILRNF